MLSSPHNVPHNCKVVLNAIDEATGSVGFTSMVILFVVGHRLCDLPQSQHHNIVNIVVSVVSHFDACGNLKGRSRTDNAKWKLT